MVAPAHSTERAVVSPAHWLHPPATLPHIAPELLLYYFVKDSPARQPVAPGPSTQNPFCPRNRWRGFHEAGLHEVTIAPLFAMSPPLALPARPAHTTPASANRPGR